MNTSKVHKIDIYPIGLFKYSRESYIFISVSKLFQSLIVLGKNEFWKFDVLFWGVGNLSHYIAETGSGHEIGNNVLQINCSFSWIVL